MNKLRFDGFWANRPRDMANLSKYVSAEMEQPVNWQVVPISHDWTDWTDCPILYMASHKAPVLTDRDYDNIRSFIQSGGMLYTQADGGELAFSHFVEQMSAKLFPAYEMADLPLNHPLYSVLFHESAKPRLRVLSNGARLLIVHSPTIWPGPGSCARTSCRRRPLNSGSIFSSMPRANTICAIGSKPTSFPPPAELRSCG